MKQMLQTATTGHILTHQFLKLTIVDVKIYNFFYKLSQLKSVKASFWFFSLSAIMGKEETKLPFLEWCL